LSLNNYFWGKSRVQNSSSKKNFHQRGLKNSFAEELRKNPILKFWGKFGPFGAMESFFIV
jgi:hypothetical protein